jgi:hypothetical protein
LSVASERSNAVLEHDPSVLACEQTSARLVLRGGAVLYATITTPLRPAGSVVRVRPWGVSHSVELDAAQIEAVSVARVHRWEDLRKITSEQAHRWRRTA